MKKMLLPFFSCLLISSSFGADIDFDLKKNKLYTVEIQDSHHRTLYSTHINNLNKQFQSKFITNDYIDNCVKNKNVVESTKNSKETGYTVSFGEDSGVVNTLIIHISQVVENKKINTGECYIEEPVVASQVITQELPFLNFEYKFHLKDNSGNELPELYYIKASSSVLKNE